jgi:hypothetical protein
MPYITGSDVQDTAVTAGLVMHKEQKEERSYGQGS